MAVYYVFQGETYNEEFYGGYVWSPQYAKGYRKNAGYEMMKKIRKGDFILHNSNGMLRAISIAKTDCYGADQPEELKNANTIYEWNDSGYRIDTEYYPFDMYVDMTNYQGWLSDHYHQDSAFTIYGRGKQQYMCHLSDDHALFILKEAIAAQRGEKLLQVLTAARAEIMNDADPEYDADEMEAINELVDDASGVKPTWTGERHLQALTKSPTLGRMIPKQDPKVAANALEHAGYLCEYDPTDRVFFRKSGKTYTEPHHLIPISKYQDFEYSLDVMENVVSLCSHCHNLLHYGRYEDKKPILEKLYNERIDALRKCGLELSLTRLELYYM